MTTNEQMAMCGFTTVLLGGSSCSLVGNARRAGEVHHLSRSIALMWGDPGPLVLPGPSARHVAKNGDHSSRPLELTPESVAKSLTQQGADPGRCQTRI